MWLTTWASDGTSLRVGMKAWENLMRPGKVSRRGGGSAAGAQLELARPHLLHLGEDALVAPPVGRVERDLAGEADQAPADQARGQLSARARAGVDRLADGPGGVEGVRVERG